MLGSGQRSEGGVGWGHRAHGLTGHAELYLRAIEAQQNVSGRSDKSDIFMGTQLAWHWQSTR